MQKTTVGVIGVILCSLALAPLLVRTDGLAAPASEPWTARPAVLLATSGCGPSGAIEHGGPPHPVAFGCRSPRSARTAEAR